VFAIALIVILTGLTLIIDADLTVGTMFVGTTMIANAIIAAVGTCGSGIPLVSGGSSHTGGSDRIDAAFGSRCALVAMAGRAVIYTAEIASFRIPDAIRFAGIDLVLETEFITVFVVFFVEGIELAVAVCGIAVSVAFVTVFTFGLLRPVVACGGERTKHHIIARTSLSLGLADLVAFAIVAAVCTGLSLPAIALGG
jgi:hypothetical protein